MQKRLWQKVKSRTHLLGNSVSQCLILHLVSVTSSGWPFMIEYARVGAVVHTALSLNLKRHFISSSAECCEFLACAVALDCDFAEVVAAADGTPSGCWPITDPSFLKTIRNL